MLSLKSKYAKLVLLGLVSLSVEACAAPIFIKTCQQLQAIGLSTGPLDGDYVQISDLDCSNIDNFVSIGGNYYTNPFAGTYDGRNYKIYGLKTHGSGLFNSISNAAISNVNLVDVWISPSSNNEDAGGLAGIAVWSEVINISITGTVNTIYGQAGGLIGRGSNVTVKQSFTDMEIRSEESYSGGLLGTLNYGTIENCYAKGLLIGDSFIGGLVAEIMVVTIKNSYFAGKIDTRRGNFYSQGLIGGSSSGPYNPDIIISSYWDFQTADLSIRWNDYMARTTSQMKQLNNAKPTYENWDPNIWSFKKGQYPILAVSAPQTTFLFLKTTPHS